MQKKKHEEEKKTCKTIGSRQKIQQIIRLFRWFRSSIMYLVHKRSHELDTPDIASNKITFIYPVNCTYQ